MQRSKEKPDLLPQNWSGLSGSIINALAGFFVGFQRVVAKKLDYPRQVANIRYKLAMLPIPDIILLLHYG